MVRSETADWSKVRFMVAVYSNGPLVMQECGKGTVTLEMIEGDIGDVLCLL
jgi:hypothetical protein